MNRILGVDISWALNLLQSLRKLKLNLKLLSLTKIIAFLEILSNTRYSIALTNLVQEVQQNMQKKNHKHCLPIIENLKNQVFELISHQVSITSRPPPQYLHSFFDELERSLKKIIESNSFLKAYSFYKGSDQAIFEDDGLRWLDMEIRKQFQFKKGILINLREICGRYTDREFVWGMVESGVNAIGKWSLSFSIDDQVNKSALFNFNRRSIQHNQLHPFHQLLQPSLSTSLPLTSQPLIIRLTTVGSSKTDIGFVLKNIKEDVITNEFSMQFIQKSPFVIAAEKISQQYVNKAQQQEYSLTEFTHSEFNSLTKIGIEIQDDNVLKLHFSKESGQIWVQNADTEQLLYIKEITLSEDVFVYPCIRFKSSNCVVENVTASYYQ